MSAVSVLPDADSWQHNRLDLTKLQVVVNQLWAMRHPGQPAPQLQNYADFQALVPSMQSADYALLARQSLANHHEVPLCIGGTSGTTGQSKLVLTRTNTPGSRPSELDIQLITELRIAGSLNPGDVVANLFMVGLFSILHHGFNRILEACYCSVIPLASLDPAKQQAQLAFMQQCGVNVLVGTPGTLIQVAHAVRESGISLPISRILFTGERMGAAKAAVLRQIFPGVRIIGCYGLSECGFVALEQPDGRYLVRDNAFFVERAPNGRLLITSLDPSLPTPVVRYDSGDQLELCHVGAMTFLHGIDRADNAFNFIGNLIELKTVRQLVAVGLQQTDALVEVQLSTDVAGRDELLVRVLTDNFSHYARETQSVNDAVLQQLLGHAEIKEALDKQAGTVRVELHPAAAATLSGRNKHQSIIDLR